MILEPVLVAIPPGPDPRTRQQVKRQSAYARAALRECAARCGAPLDGWVKDADEVPLPQEGYYWSVSHKRHWAAAVIANRPVGIDIERISLRPAAVLEALACSDEWAMIGDRSARSFARLWTAKEAVLKAKGVGIAGFSACRLVALPDDRHVTLSFEGRDWLVEHYYHADHVAAVTREDYDVRWRVLDDIADVALTEPDGG